MAAGAECLGFLLIRRKLTRRRLGHAVDRSFTRKKEEFREGTPTENRLNQDAIYTHGAFLTINLLIIPVRPSL